MQCDAGGLKELKMYDGLLRRDKLTIRLNRSRHAAFRLAVDFIVGVRAPTF
jgi:hypothetical protein